MSEIDKIAKITDRAGTGAPNFTNGFTIAGVDSGITAFTHTEGSTEPSNPSNGDTWWDTGNDAYYVRMNDAWKQWLGADTSFSGPAYMGTRGIIAGGYGSGSAHAEDIQYITIATPGNATDFGDLAAAFYYGTSCSDGTRAFSFGGYNNSTATLLNNIQQTVIATTGNATDVGDISVPSYFNASLSNATRAVCAVGRTRENATSGSFSYVNTMEYITTASAGNSTDFGDQTDSKGLLAACSDSTRGLFAGGSDASSVRTDTIDYITIQTAGNAADFGDLSQTNNRNSACANATRGVIGGGFTVTGSVSRVNTIEYVTIQSPGNATDFGDLAAINYGLAAFSGSPS